MLLLLTRSMNLFISHICIDRLLNSRLHVALLQSGSTNVLQIYTSNERQVRELHVVQKREWNNGS